jgi:hypothetical protein
VAFDEKTKETIISGMGSVLAVYMCIYVYVYIYMCVCVYTCVCIFLCARAAALTTLLLLPLPYEHSELHLEIYVERLKREYNVECQVRPHATD